MEQGSRVSNRAQRKTPADWARFWFSQLARFHKVHDHHKWVFTERDVVDFLRASSRPGYLRGND